MQSWERAAFVPNSVFLGGNITQKITVKHEKTATEVLLLRLSVVPPERHLKKGLQNIIG